MKCQACHHGLAIFGRICWSCRDRMLTQAGCPSRGHARTPAYRNLLVASNAREYSFGPDFGDKFKEAMLDSYGGNYSQYIQPERKARRYVFADETGIWV